MGTAKEKLTNTADAFALDTLRITRKCRCCFLQRRKLQIAHLKERRNGGNNGRMDDQGVSRSSHPCLLRRDTDHFCRYSNVEGGLSLRVDCVVQPVMVDSMAAGDGSCSDTS